MAHGSVDTINAMAVGDLPNLGMIVERQELVVNLPIYCATKVIVNSRHIFEVEYCAVVFVFANFAREFSGAVGCVEVQELVQRQVEAGVGEKVAVVVIAKLRKIVEQGDMTAVVAQGILFVARIALSALFHRVGLAGCCCCSSFSGTSAGKICSYRTSVPIANSRGPGFPHMRAEAQARANQFRTAKAFSLLDAAVLLLASLYQPITTPSMATQQTSRCHVVLPLARTQLITRASALFRLLRERAYCGYVYDT